MVGEWPAHLLPFIRPSFVHLTNKIIDTPRLGEQINIKARLGQRGGAREKWFSVRAAKGFEFSDPDVPAQVASSCTLESECTECIFTFILALSLSLWRGQLAGEPHRENISLSLSGRARLWRHTFVYINAPEYYARAHLPPSTTDRLVAHESNCINYKCIGLSILVRWINIWFYWILFEFFGHFSPSLGWKNLTSLHPKKSICL